MLNLTVLLEGNNLTSTHERTIMESIVSILERTTHARPQNCILSRNDTLDESKQMIPFDSFIPCDLRAIALITCLKLNQI